MVSSLRQQAASAPTSALPTNIIVSSSVPSTHTTTTSASAQLHRLSSSASAKPVPNVWNINIDEAVIPPHQRKVRHLQRVCLKGFAQQLPYDVFFSLSLPGDKEPLYISEIASNVVLDSSFQQFCLSAAFLHNSVVLSIYTKPTDSHGDSDSQWRLSHQYDVQLDKLLYMHSQIDEITVPPNLQTSSVVLITLMDGVYIVPLDQQFVNSYEKTMQSLSLNAAASRQGKIVYGKVPSLTYGGFLKLLSLEKYMWELTLKKDSLQELICQECEGTELQLATLTNKVRLLRSAIKDLTEQVASLQKDHHVPVHPSSQQQQQPFSPSSNNNQDTLEALQVQCATLSESNTSILRQINELKCQTLHTLSLILPLSPKYTTTISSSSHNITLPKLKLPTILNPNTDLLTSTPTTSNFSSSCSTSSSHDTEELNFTLGNLIHLLQIISHLWGIKLRYDVKYIGSTSFVIDDKTPRLKQRQQQRQQRFAVFLGDNSIGIGGIGGNGGVIGRQRFAYALGLIQGIIEDLEKISSS